MKKSIAFTLVLVAVLGITWLYRNLREHDREPATLSFKPILLENKGWGYQIFRGNTLFIQQTQIPCIEKNIPFKSRKDAEKVAKLVVRKIQKNEIPRVEKKELNNLGITW